MLPLGRTVVERPAQKTLTQEKDMGPKYETEYKDSSGIGGFQKEYVKDAETGERVGELVRAEWERSGDKIADGEWTPYSSDDDD